MLFRSADRDGESFPEYRTQHVLVEKNAVVVEAVRQSPGHVMVASSLYSLQKNIVSPWISISRPKGRPARDGSTNLCFSILRDLVRSGKNAPLPFCVRFHKRFPTSWQTSHRMVRTLGSRKMVGCTRYRAICRRVSATFSARRTSAICLISSRYPCSRFSRSWRRYAVWRSAIIWQAARLILYKVVG